MRRPRHSLLLALAFASVTPAQVPASDPRIEAVVSAWKAASPGDRDAVLKSFGLDQSLITAVSDSGEELQKKGDFPSARAHFEACAAAAIGVENALYSSICLQLTGGLDRLEGKYEDAEKHYKEALEYANKPGAARRIPLIYNNLAGVYVVQSRFEEGLAILKATIEYDDKEGIKGDAAPYQNIGSIYGLTGDMTRSLQYFLKAQQMYEEKGDERRLALVHYNIGVLYTRQANYAYASREFDAAVALATKVGDNTQLAMMYGDVGKMRGLEGKPKEAREALNRAVELSRGMGFKSAYCDALINLAGFESDRGDLTLAVQHFQEALQVADQLKDAVNQGGALRGLSLVSRRSRNFGDAVKYAEESLRRVASVGDRQGQWQSEALTGMAWRASGDNKKALESFERAISLIEQQRGVVAGGEVEKQLFFEQAAYPYRELALIEAESGNSMGALQAAERTRARALLDIIEAGPNPIDRLMSEEEKSEEKALRARIAVANAHPGATRERDDAWHAYQVFLGALYNRNPELRTWRGESTVISQTELDALVPDAKTAILEFLSGQDETLLFAITRDGGKVHVTTSRLPIGRDALALRAATYRSQVEGRDPAWRATSRDLYQLLLKPAAAQLRNRTRVRIVADGPLWELPFQSLPGPAGGYWIEEASISMSPSISFLRDQTAAKKASPAVFTRDLVAFAGTPELNSQVKRIGALYDAGRSLIRADKEAVESGFRKDAPGARVLHIAAHGVMDQQNALHSRIILSSPGNKAGAEDGLIEAWELMRMNLNSDLVVLSACETGRGRVADGEGLIGLTWALFVAGAKTTVVSQWQVEAGSTTELMVGLHQRLRKGEEPAQALRGAVLALMKDERYRHPMYWSAFVVAGL